MKRAAAIVAAKLRGLRVINRCSPLVKLWANPRLRLESRRRHSLLKQCGTGKSSRFPGQNQAARGYHTSLRVSNQPPLSIVRIIAKSKKHANSLNFLSLEVREQRNGNKGRR